MPHTLSFTRSAAPFTLPSASAAAPSASPLIFAALSAISSRISAALPVALPPAISWPASLSFRVMVAAGGVLAGMPRSGVPNEAAPGWGGRRQNAIHLHPISMPSTTLSLTARSTDLRLSFTESVVDFCAEYVVVNGLVVRVAWEAAARAI